MCLGLNKYTNNTLKLPIIATEYLVTQESYEGLKTRANHYTIGSALLIKSYGIPFGEKKKKT